MFYALLVYIIAIYRYYSYFINFCLSCYTGRCEVSQRHVSARRTAPYFGRVRTFMSYVKLNKAHSNTCARDECSHLPNRLTDRWKDRHLVSLHFENASASANFVVWVFFYVVRIISTTGASPLLCFLHRISKTYEEHPVNGFQLLDWAI